MVVNVVLFAFSVRGSFSSSDSYLFIFKILFIYFLERGEGREKERERHISVVASCAPPPGALAHNPGMCPDWESNQQPFGL